MEKILTIAKETNKINENSYFKNLNSSTLKKNYDLKLFLDSQETFISAIDNWSKVLGLMLSKVPSDSQRSVIIENLNDEHGCGDLTKSHVNTFRMLLISLNYDKEIKLYNTTSPSYNSVRNFNVNLTNKINDSNWIFSIAILGMIEYVYVDVSKFIHNYLCNFLQSDKINHYSTHKILDVHHYTTLFELLVPHIKTNYDEIYFGMRYGYKLINELYLSLNYFVTPMTASL